MRRPSRRIPLARRERILLGETALDGVDHVATTHAIYRRDPGRAGPRWQRIAWTDIAELPSTESTLELTLAQPPFERVRLALTPHSRMAQLILERVRACTLSVQYVDISEQCTVRVSATRDPVDDSVTWSAQLGSGCDRSDPTIEARLDAMVNETRSQFGV